RWLSQHVGEESGSPILISLLIPFGAYLLAEQLRASGILAAVAAGVTMSYVELHGRALATTRVQRAAVWGTVQLALNGVVFVLLGEQLPEMLLGAVASVEQSGHRNPWWLAAYAVTITVGLALLRLLWVWVSLRRALFKARHGGTPVRRPHWRLLLATSLAGVRGAITLAGVMTLPFLMPDGAPFPARDLAVFLATAVILLSLVMASVGLPRLLKGLVLPEEPSASQEEDLARHDAALAAIAAIEKVQRAELRETTDADLHTQAGARVIALYQRRLDGRGAGESAGQLRKADQIERTLRVAGLQAERETVFSLARRSLISDETARRLVREIDLLESRYR
ncbi:MAG: cation:proton antiporter, partial [Rhodoferax sp.]